MLTIMEEIGKNIEYFRKKTKMSKTELASSVGVSIAAVSKWEKAQNGIDIDTLFSVCRVLDVSPNDIFGAYAVGDFTAHEREIVDAYRAQPDMQPAVDRLLGLRGKNNQTADTSTA